MLVHLLPPLLQLHGCISTKGNPRRPMRRVSCPPGLHRSGWGVPPAKGPFGMQLSLCTAACWAPRVPWLGCLSTVKRRAMASGSLQSPAFRGLWVQLPPDCPGCRGHLCFWESSVTSWKLLSGMGLKGWAQQVSSSVAFHWRTESALGTFTQPHSISREVGAGLSLQWDRDKDRRQAQGHLLREPAPASLVLPALLSMSGALLGHMPMVCFWGQGRARVLWREEALALGSAIALGVRIQSVWPVPATMGALWLVGRRELWGQGAGGWHRNPLPAQAGAGLARAQPRLREKLPAFHVRWGCFSQ